MGGEHYVFRAALFSIVLTLAIGQNASLLCQVWCQDTTSAGCSHQDSTTSPSVSAHATCRTDVGAAVAFVREDPRRAAADPDTQKAVATRRFRLTPSPRELGTHPECRRQLCLDERPLLIALRL